MIVVVISSATKVCERTLEFRNMRIERLLLLIPLLLPVTCTGSPPSKHRDLQYSISNHTIPLLPPWKEYELYGLYTAEVSVGSQLFHATLDTGSSDTWLIATDANCTDVATLRPVVPAKCGYTGSRYDPNASFEAIPNMHLNGSYGNGMVLNGPMGHTDLIFGGLTIPKQAISAISYISAAGLPEGSVSGLIGLAYQSLTSAFTGTDPSKDIRCKGNSSCGPVTYSPFINTLFQYGPTEPVFSFALSRSKIFGGLMTIGGIPSLDDISVNATGNVIASSPIKPLGNATALSFYTTDVDGFVYSNVTPNAGQGQYVVDTGTIPNLFHKEEAQAINALFDPPATFNETIGLFVVHCNAHVPQLGVSIGGQIFYHNPKDMIFRQGDQCLSAVQTSGGALLPILGASWLKSVLAIFDVGATEMTFVSRVYYEDS